MTSTTDISLRSLLAVNIHKFHGFERAIDVISSAVEILEHHNGTNENKIDLAIFARRNDPVEIDLIAEKYGQHATVIALPESMNGVALNTQLEYAIDKGFDIFFRADADDLFTPDRFALQLEKMIEDPEIDVCGGALEYINIDENTTYIVAPKEDPGHLEFLSNAYCLHPTFAIRLKTLAGTRYWDRRGEDKNFIYTARVNGLKFYNLPNVVGTYEFSSDVRSRILINALCLWINLKWSFKFNWLLVFPSTLLFFLRLCLRTQGLRNFRNWLRFKKKDDFS